MSSPKDKEHQVIIGLDSGSVSTKIAVLDSAGNIMEDRYERHYGQPLETSIRILQNLLSIYGKNKIRDIAITGTTGKIISELLGVTYTNEVISVTAAVGALYPEIRTIIEMGGEDSKLIILKADEKNGEGSILEDFSMNAACAAGTGSFLDQQASRLGIRIEEDFGRMALQSKVPPRIAGRCSVFAKSDMIHLQQIGTPDYDIVAGLCFAVARNFKSSIVKGKPMTPPIAFIGGVASNSGMIRAFREVLEVTDDTLIIPPYFSTLGAIGMALLTIRKPREHANPDYARLFNFDKSDLKKAQRLEPLRIEKSLRVEGEVYPIGDDEKIEAFIGVDIGSVSTNVVAIDRQKRVLSRCYLPTAGRPIEAVKQGLEIVGTEVGDKIVVMGVGTTGSGRYMIGDLIGADVVRNEITAQARAAIEIDPTVDTIFEIGGQDSKYISVENAVVVNFEMNKVCAAGTGSFLEEQAERLNINIKNEFSDLALSCSTPCKLGERCTVFIESDLVSQEQAGASREELVSGLAYSIALNYLNRVVGKRRIGNNIFFQGGTANNKAVVAAFEKITGKKITIPPHNDVTGSIGIAILSMENSNSKPSKFKGFDFSKRNYALKSFVCRDCSNLCEIKRVKFENEKPLFYGSRCEKFDFDKKFKKGEDLPDLFDERERLLLGSFYDKAEGVRIIRTEDSRATPRSGKPRIGIPRFLQFYENFPYWKAFFETIGWEIALSDRTSREVIHDGSELVTAEFCFPVKVAFGVTRNMLKKDIDYIFLPSIISQYKTNDQFTRSYNCPFVQSIPYSLRSNFDFKTTTIKTIEPHLNFQKGRIFAERELQNVFKEFGVKSKTISQAMDVGEAAQKLFHATLQERGDQILRELNEGKYERALIIIGRSYNTCDDGMNMNLPRKLKDLGVLAIPMDMVRVEDVEVWQEHPNMYWKYGQRIVGAAEAIKNRGNLFGVYITNFGCGPDSMISHIFKDVIGEVPYLQLEVDEHSADAGILTRIEAFMDSLDSIKGKTFTASPRKTAVAHFGKEWKLYLSYMCDHAIPLAAAFRRCGIEAEALPESTEKTSDIGRKYTNGKECYPCIVTTGDMILKIESPDFDRTHSAFFMPTSQGPCRFGQYSTLHKIILRELGYGDIPILSPGSEDSYSNFGNIDKNFRRVGWQAMVATDVLEKMLRETRPYEKHPGETEQVYKSSLYDLADCIEQGGDIVENLAKAGENLMNIPVDKSEKRPIIGMVGEIFLRLNRFSNNNTIKQIESLGGEVWLAPIAEWIFYTSNRMMIEGREDKNFKIFFKAWLTNFVQTRDERKLHKPFQKTLRYHHDPPVAKILKHAFPYMHESFGGEAIVSIGKAIDYYMNGASGIANVQPFTCMPGTIVTAISKKIRDDYGNLPWVNLFFDGQQDTVSLNTRLEAFMFQARHFVSPFNNGKAHTNGRSL